MSFQEQAKLICSDVKYNEFEPDNPIYHCRLNKKMLDALTALHNQEMEAVIGDFAEFCHERYLGCAQNSASPTEYEYSYQTEVVIMAEAYIQQRAALTRIRSEEVSDA